MPTIVLNREWLEQNSQRSYPLTRDSEKLDISSSFSLPENFIVDLSLSVPTSLNVDPAGFFIRYVGNYSTGFSVVVGYTNADDESFDVASANVPRAAHTPFDVYELNGVAGGVFAAARGKVVIGRLDNIDLQPSGLFEFDLNGGRLEPRTVMPTLNGVTSLSVQSQGVTLGPFYNVVRLRAGDNMKIEVEEGEEGEDVVIVLSAIDGTGLNEDCVCSEERRPIYTINGVGPDENNNFNLLGTECIEISELSNGLRIDDICSKPCCGCDELEKLTQSLELFGSKSATLDNFLVGLEATVHQMDMVVLGSRLNDRGCGTS